MRRLLLFLRVATALLCLAGSRVIHGGEPLTLAEARRRAGERGWDLLAARTAVAQAEAVRTGALALPNPTLSLSVSKVPTDGAPAGTPRGNAFFDRSYDSIVSLGELVEIGKRGPRRASAEAGLSGSRLKLEDARRRLDANVVKAYAAAALAEETARIDRLSAEALDRSAAIARERWAAGDVSKSEASQVAVAAGRFDNDTRAAQAAAVQARLALETLLGEPESTGAVPLADDLARLSAALSAGPPEAGDEARLTRAVAERPDVRAAEAAVARAEHDLKLQKAERVPDPTFSVQYEREPPDVPNSAGIGVSLPLPILNRNTGGIRAAEAALEGARRDLAQAQAKARAEIAGAKAQWGAARDRRSLLAGRLVPDAEAVRESVAFAYGKGGASLLELLEAERGLNDVRQAAASATTDLVTAAADYATALGVPIP